MILQDQDCIFLENYIPQTVHLGKKERGYLNIYPGKRKRWFHILFPLPPGTYHKARGIQQPWHDRAPVLCQKEGSSRIYSPIHLVQQLQPSSLQFPVGIPPGAHINATLSSGLIQCSIKPYLLIIFDVTSQAFYQHLLWHLEHISI